MPFVNFFLQFLEKLSTFPFGRLASHRFINFAPDFFFLFFSFLYCGPGKLVKMGDSSTAIDMIQAAINQMQNLQVGNEQSNTPRVRDLQCHSYTLGQDFPSFCAYFCENVRTAYNYPVGDPRLYDAFCTWIGAKMEVGPTLTAYKSIPAAIRSDWRLLKDELSRLFMNEEERQKFLGNPASFPKGTQSLLQYRNEIVRLVGLYQPGIIGVPTEYQRQLVERFICGLDDPELQRKLRFHCKRDKLTIGHAYEFAVDYESSKVNGDLVRTVAASANVSTLTSMAATEYPHAPRSPRQSQQQAAVCNYQVDDDIDYIQQNSTAIEELKAGQAQLEEQFSSFQQYVVDRLDHLESLILGQAAQQSLDPTALMPHGLDESEQQ